MYDAILHILGGCRRGRRTARCWPGPASMSQSARANRRAGGTASKRTAGVRPGHAVPPWAFARHSKQSSTRF